MAKVLIPSTKQAFYSKAQAAAFTAPLASLRNRYGTMIDYVAALCFVPKFAIYAKLLIENVSGNANAVSSAGAIGLMQIKPLSATDMLTIERKDRRLTEEEKKELKRLLPAKYEALVNAQMGNQLISAADLKRPEVSLFVGAVHLSTLISEHTEGDLIRLDLVGLRYNQGYYYRRSSIGNFEGNTDALLATLSGEARDYVLKLCGMNGTLDITT